MKLRRITAALLAVTLQVTSLPAAADEKAVVDAMEFCVDFVDYGGGHYLS